MKSKSERIIKFIIECIKTAQSEDERMNESCDYPRVPPYSEDKRKYLDAIKFMKDLHKKLKEVENG